jgi:hypothetical protein
MPDMALLDRTSSIHVMSQVAACRASVGVALIDHPVLLELRGRPEELGAIAVRLAGRPIVVGQTVRVDGGWWRSVTSRRALALADPARPLAFAKLVRALADAAPDVALEDLSARHAAVLLAGRLTGGLAATPAARLARPVLDAGDGDDFRILVLPHERAADTRHVLLEAGRADGAIAVGPAAAELYRASRPGLRRSGETLTINSIATGAFPA